MSKKIIIIFYISISFLVNSCGGKIPGADARKVSPDPKERVKKNLEEGKGFRLSESLGGNNSGTFEFATSNELWRASIISKDARQSSLEVANSKVPELFPPKLSLSLKPLPSSRFFLTRSFGSGETFLASAPGIFPPQEFNIRLMVTQKTKIIFLLINKVVFNEKYRIYTT